MNINIEEILKLRAELVEENSKSVIKDSERKAKTSWLGLSNKPSSRTLRKRELASK